MTQANHLFGKKKLSLKHQNSHNHHSGSTKRHPNSNKHHKISQKHEKDKSNVAKHFESRWFSVIFCRAEKLCGKHIVFRKTHL